MIARTEKFLKSKHSEYLSLVLFLITFESVLVLIAKSNDLSILRDPLMLGMLGLASYRGGRAIAFNYFFIWLRDPFSVTIQDSSGAGQTTVPAGSGLKKVIGELLCCPICASTWVALVLAGLLVLYYPFGFILSAVLAIAGIAEFLNWFSEMAEWKGREARQNCGKATIDEK